MQKGILSLTLLLAITGMASASDIWQSLFKEKLREATSGSSDAQYDVGAMYQNGRGVKANRSKAIEWYTKAAGQENSKAVSRLELMKANEARFSKTGIRAIQGNVDSQYDLGNMYEKGIGTPIDYQQARDWYGKAAGAGHAEASFRLGLMYHEGAGTRRNDKTAFKWFRDAAEKGSTPAQYYLGKLYAAGTGVRKDYATALQWYSRAADGGFDQARGAIIEVTEKMNQPEPVKVTKKKLPKLRATARNKPKQQSPEQPPRQPVVERKLIAQPTLAVAREKPVKQAHNAQLMETLMLTTWSRQSRPVSYLPSTINNCRIGDKKITCFSGDQTRNSGGNEVKFKTKAIISDFSKDGSFKVTYRNLVVTASRTSGNTRQETESAYGDEGTGPGLVVNTGWGIQHSVECTLHDSNTLTCIKDKSRPLQITSQQNLANGR